MFKSNDIKPMFSLVQTTTLLVLLVILGGIGFLIWRSERAAKTHAAIAAFNESRWEEGLNLSLNADRGDAKIQAGLGMCYMLGLGGVDHDRATGFLWFQKSAYNGDLRGQSLLGQAYYQGWGVAQNYDMAVRWWRGAANKGWSAAQYDLGQCLLEGKGVTKDEREAVEWFKKAAEQDHPDAHYALGICYISGSGVTKDTARGVQWLKKGAEKGSVDAQRMLGGCYRVGLGVECNLDEARKWLDKAARQGDEKASQQLSELDGKR